VIPIIIVEYTLLVDILILTEAENRAHGLKAEVCWQHKLRAHGRSGNAEMHTSFVPTLDRKDEAFQRSSIATTGITIQAIVASNRTTRMDINVE
jgi:hypothetical protein